MPEQTPAPAIAEHRSVRSLGGLAALASLVVRIAARACLIVLVLLPVGGAIAIPWRSAAPVVSPAGALAVAGMFLVALLRPGDGLLLCAAFATLAGRFAGLLHTEPLLGETLVLAFLGGWLAGETVRRRPAAHAACPCTLPALALAAVVGASVLVQVIVAQVSVDYPWPYARQVVAYLATDYLVVPNRFGELGAAARILEGIGLFIATVDLSRRDASLARRAVAMAAIGAIGVAALNVSRIGEVGFRSTEPLRAVARSLVAVRISTVFPDFNAAGSYLVMMCFVALGLAVARRRARFVWIAAASLMLAALWITGSRVAVAAVPIGLLVFAWLAKTARWSSLAAKRVVAAGVAIVGALAVTAGLWYLHETAAKRSVPVAVQWRVELGRAALRMFRSSPVFGIGVGRFWEQSGEFIDEPFRRFVPRENAHNNYLQILAELGAAGLIAFLWLLATVARGAWARRRRGSDAILAGTAAGMVAFLVTCLTGHPLLIREVSFAFWLVLGLIAGLSSDTRRFQASAWDNQRVQRSSLVTSGRLLPAVVICLAVSVPIRAHQFIEHDMDFVRATIGFSDWHFDGAGIRYRTMTGRAEFYVPGGTCDMTMGLQVEAGGRRATTEVEIRVDGDAGNRFEAVTGSWRGARLVFPDSSARRYRKIQLLTMPDAGIVLRTARPVLVDCHGNRL